MTLTNRERTASPNRGSALGTDRHGWLVRDIYDVTIVASLLWVMGPWTRLMDHVNQKWALEHLEHLTF